jgi:sigma-B regulation protein RsbU (phosphoserine phosphatase)
MITKSSRQITQYKINADLSMIQELRGHFHEFLYTLGLSDQDKDSWLLCFTEAINNSIEHGSKEKTDPVRVRWWSDEESVWLEIQDIGSGPDLENEHKPAELPTDPLSEGGRGRYIIESSVDKVEHWRGQRGYVMQMMKTYPHLNSVIPQNSDTEAILDELSDAYESLSIYDRMAENLLKDERVDSFVHSGLELFMDSRDYNGICIQVRDKEIANEYQWITQIDEHGAFGEFNHTLWQTLEEKESVTWNRESGQNPFKSDDLVNYVSGGCVPVMIEEAAVAVIAVAYSGEHSEIHSSDIRNLRALADVIAISISRSLIEHERDQKKRLEVEMSVATKLQHQLLPLGSVDPLKIPGYDLFYRSMSALEIAGDYVEVRKNKNGDYVGCVIDVMGKGVSAAILAGIFRSQFIAYSFRSNSSLSDFLERCNNALKIQLGEATMFITAAVFRLDPETNQFYYSAAGHPPTLLFSKNKEVQQLESTGPPMGLFESQAYEESMVEISEEDRIIIVTDGLYEWTHAESIFGWDSLVDWFKKSWEQDAAEVWDRLSNQMKGARKESNIQQEDDETLLILTRNKL